MTIFLAGTLFWHTGYRLLVVTAIVSLGKNLLDISRNCNFSGDHNLGSGHARNDGWPKKKNYNQGTPKKLLYIMLWLFWCLLGMGILLKTGHIQTHHFIIRLFRTCILQNIYHTNKSIKIIVQIAFSTLKKTNTAINTFQLSAKPPAYSISQPPPFPATPFPSRGLSLEPLRLQDLTGFRSCIWITTQSLQQHLVKAWHGWRMAMATPTMKAPMGLRDNWWFS